MTYQPKHLAPSLDYKTWIVAQRAGLSVMPMPPEWNEPLDLAPIIAAINRSAKDLAAVARRIPERPRAGHEWDSRSWFA